MRERREIESERNRGRERGGGGREGEGEREFETARERIRLRESERASERAREGLKNLDPQPCVDSSAQGVPGDTTPCRVTPVILHGVVSPERLRSEWIYTGLYPLDVPTSMCSL